MFISDPSEGIVSKQTFKPGDYSLDFLKEKIKSLCYFLVSISIDNPTFIYIHIGEYEYDEYEGNANEYLFSLKITYMHCDINSFMEIFEDCYEDKKTRFLYKIPTKPFHIIVKPEWWHKYPYPSRWELRGPLHSCSFIEEESRGTDEETEEESRGSDEEIEEESQEEEPRINTEKTFKENECVICLTNPPNVLFCNCGHIAICVECDIVKSLKDCPMCKTETTIKRTLYIEY